ncbi:hypothetical protein BE221DRAFT_66391 [Ostreococcus tauri]|uniref:Uncharacterized protein n=1 Tax=Ostreococcus tauri TaxID=70448 RepID=A0A1Y5IGK6_OSTTA|nr:hypothetical protein BE221DRAFT_68036 [Ostreococcus tauri]OUS49216.1 hypothetical protein BE221DRAFT_66391 [Ostreococcus tauri]
MTTLSGATREPRTSARVNCFLKCNAVFTSRAPSARTPTATPTSLETLCAKGSTSSTPGTSERTLPEALLIVPPRRPTYERRTGRDSLNAAKCARARVSVQWLRAEIGKRL